MSIEGISYRKIRSEDASDGFELSNESGWNQTLSDWKFIIGELPVSGYVAQKDNKIIGTVISINYSIDFSWVCMVLVAKEYRRQGISTHLVKLLLDELGNDKIIKLDATTDGEKIYSKSGFHPEYKIHRMILTQNFKGEATQQKEIKHITIDFTQRIAGIDHTGFGVERLNLFTHFQNKANVKNIYYDRDGNLSYVFSRIGNKYFHLGPLRSNQESIAKELLAEACSVQHELPIIVDVVEWQTDFIVWLESVGFILQRSFTRMWKNKNGTNTDWKNQILIFGPEFG